LDPKSIQTDAMNKIQIHIISMTSQKNRLNLNWSSKNANIK